ncbi:MAG: hypothetical protein V4515_14320 [Chloroflexota bacterium]
MDSERFFEELRDAVSAVRVADVALEASAGRPQSAENLRAVIDRRRARDAVGSLLASRPEELAGLILALATSANETYAGVNGRLSELETRVQGIAETNNLWDGS